MNGTYDEERDAMMRKALFVIFLCAVLICSGCGKDGNSNNMEACEETEYGDGAETYEEAEYGDGAETYEETEYGDGTKTYEETEYGDGTETHEETEHENNAELYEKVKDYLDVENDTEIAGYEWMQYDGNPVLHVKIQYKEQPENAYQHKEDYFLFMTQDDEISQVLAVDYGDKGIHIGLDEETECAGNHSLGEGCGFDAHFEDVTFDGRKDLIISVGNSRHAAYYCAYICEDDGFRYEKTFEHIPSYEVKSDEKVICGSDTDGMGWFADMTYEYKDGKFVLTDCVEKEILE